ncbi:outer membrane beta-barrel protein [Novosphingobium aerophilum]|uniref:outer membrane beta-barrel protein n=1 Tax=Novosphingobium TaxID=165696 RepID=UPI002D78CD1E|nr:outer membrane beta-barrel protein [Novosphingobium sp. RL4]WRT91642.1 outer membrane beta-barrel protein [Novosphingobium sp. RL4]
MNFYKYGLVAAALLAQPALADETKLSGLRAEARVGWETPTVSDGDVYKLGQSVSFGGEIGYDLPVSTKVTVGPYVNYEYARSKECDSGLCLGSAGNFAAGGRIGLNLGTRSQLYAKVGYDRMKLKATFDGDSDSETLDGIQGAIGFDYNLSAATYVGVEFNYADLGSFEGVNFQRRQVALTGGMRF